LTIYLWPTVLLIAGLLLLFLETFVPSAGVLPLLCLGVFGASLWSAFSISLFTGLVFLTIDLALLPVAILTAASIWPHTPIARFFLLKPPGEDESILPSADDSPRHELQANIGHHGRTITDLRPGGTVIIDGRPLDAMTDEGFIAADSLVKVIGVRQSQLLVRRESAPFSQAT
jgi:membrane-bound serine protease (ClpP class)